MGAVPVVVPCPLNDAPATICEPSGFGWTRRVWAGAPGLGGRADGFGYDYAGHMNRMTNWTTFSSGSGARYRRGCGGDHLELRSRAERSLGMVGDAGRETGLSGQGHEDRTVKTGHYDRRCCNELHSVVLLPIILQGL